MLATVSFIDDLDIYRTQKPYELIGFSEEEVSDQERTNITYRTCDSVAVSDLRSSEPRPSLDQHGFAWIQRASKCMKDSVPFTSPAQDNGIVEAYLEETVAMTKEVTGATSVFVYDWRYRKNVDIQSYRRVTDASQNTRYFTYAPIGHVHGDYSYQGGLDRIFLHLTQSELETFSQSGARIRLMNLWRPFTTVENAPLGLVDRRSVASDDVIEVDKVLPNSIEYEICIWQREHYKWYYISRQSPEDAILFVQWEERDVPVDTTGVPHAALAGPESELGSRPRESIEVRMIVVS